MNISELARKLRVHTPELRQKLPAMGFDIGARAIKVDNATANRIIRDWKFLNAKYEAEQKAAEEAAVVQEKDQVVEKKDIKIPEYITVRDLATKMNIAVTKVLAELMKNGVLASMNERIDYDTAAIISSEFNFEAEKEAEDSKKIKEVEALEEKLKKQDKKDLVARAPVIVVMGHVDHGKTKLLDAVRKTDVVSGETGGITQHIGAYQVHRKDQVITFIDTPGHEAFTTMRSRGARVADIAILVIAADDGFKPQTEESLKIIKSAGIPMVVAINKIDKPDANVDMVKKQLAEHNLTPEEWGGKLVVAEISAKQNIGIDELLDLVLLVASLEKKALTANPKGEAIGTIIESHVDKGEGPVATALIQSGTLKIGDGIWVAQNYYGKVRLLRDYRGENIKEAIPSTPAKIIGLKAAPGVGDILESGTAKKGKVSKYHLKKQATGFTETKVVSDEEETKNITTLNLIIKSDVLGSLEAILASLEEFNQEDAKVKIISKGLGNITSTDVEHASAGNAAIFGFHVNADTETKSLAMEKKVEIKDFGVIYELIDETKKRLEALLSPDVIVTELGRLKVLGVFRKEKKAMIVGGKITKGQMKNNSKARVIRENIEIATGMITQLQQNKVDVPSCDQGNECGIRFEGKPIILEGDIIEIFEEEQKQRKIK